MRVHICIGKLFVAPIMGLAVVWSSLFSTNQASADLVYQYVFDKSVYTADAGGFVDVQISLLETVTESDTSLLATEGLVGAGVRVRFDLAPIPSHPATVASLGDILPNTAAFDDPFGYDTDLVAGSSAGFSVAVDIASPAVFGSIVGPNQYRIELGVFRFTAGIVPGEATFLTAIDRSGADETITGTNGFVLDGQIRAGFARIEVRSIPEPSSMALILLASPAFILFRKRRSPRRHPGRDERAASRDSFRPGEA